MIRRLFIQTTYRGDKDPLYSRDFGFKSWYITEYITRDIKKQKYKYEKVQYLGIEIDRNNNEIKYNKIYNSIMLYLQQNSDNIMFQDTRIFREKILFIIDESAKEFEKFIPGIEKTIEQAILSFKNANYKNIWTFKTRKIKDVGTGKLECELNEKHFTLSLIIDNQNKEEIFRKEILKTLPDSIFYYDEFKELKIEDDKIIVYNRSDDVMFQILVDEIKKNTNSTLELDAEGNNAYANPQYSSIPGIDY